MGRSAEAKARRNQRTKERRRALTGPKGQETSKGLTQDWERVEDAMITQRQTKGTFKLNEMIMTAEEANQIRVEHVKRWFAGLDQEAAIEHAKWLRSGTMPDEVKEFLERYLYPNEA